MSVDLAKLGRLIRRIDAEREHIERLSSSDSLLEDDDLLASLKYRFVVVIEAAIDVAQHVISSSGFRAPQSFADAFVVLGDHGVIEPELGAALQDMARFRNLLVHGYANVDDTRVVKIARTRTGDLAVYARTVASWAAAASAGG